DDLPVVANDRHAPGRIAFAERQMELRRRILAAQRDVPASRYRLSCRQHGGRRGEHGNIPDGTYQIVDLRQRVDGLLEQKVLRRIEHPMRKLPGCELAQGQVEMADDVADRAEPAARQAPLRCEMGGMMDEVMIDLKR